MSVMHKKFFLMALTAACSMTGSVSAMDTDSDLADRVALDDATAAMCGKSIVILGEASHGDGHGDAVKVALVKHLVAQCGFNGVLFESSFYEYIPIARSVRASKPVAPELIAAAVGGLWKFEREVMPLFDFLAAQVNSGKVALGGLDFQAGGLQQPYSNEVMFTELAAHLAGARRDLCTTLYHSRIYGDDAPSGMSEHDRSESLKSCLLEIGTKLDVAKPDSIDADQRSALANLRAWLAEDGHSQQALIQSRDRMMAQNAVNFIDRLGKPAKLIIWAHNAHAARDTAALADYGNADNLGAALSHRYGSQVFALAITARGGEYRWSRGTNKVIPAPPADALEAPDSQAKFDTSTFIGLTALQRAGLCSSGLLSHSYSRAKWADAFDSVLVLNAEHAPHSTRP